ncbi:hypothetical protein HRI_003691900 [Hibiscus trionum]|uniref:Uncharacterized protein n=1 Tax=Hibiscus trionum TaxID=183268 RepID=A0A9W7ISB2_HIBTR|nr:hypothetical protein HRI_003691900 [Hibiscus trionum]
MMYFCQFKTVVPNVDSARPTAKDQPLTMAHIQGREADIRVMSELNHALENKVSSVLHNLRQHNAYPANHSP